MSTASAVSNSWHPVIDSHQHFWRRGDAHQDWRGPEHVALERDFEPADLRRAMPTAGVDATVLIQSVNTAEENERLLDYAVACPFVAGVVAWLPLSDPRRAAPLLTRLATDPVVRGVRCLIARDDLAWLASTEATALLRDLADAGLCWDVVPVTESQVRAVLAAAERVPGLRIVIDHLGRPPVDRAGWEPWAGQVTALAAAPNVAMKVSVGIDVLTAWSTWDAAGLHPYVAHALACFGEDRMMLASNWPVVELRQKYATAWRDLAECLRSGGVADLSGPLGENARRWYRLPPVSEPAKTSGVPLDGLG